MGLLYVLLLILLSAIMLVFAVALKIAFTLDTRKENMKLVLFWLYPFIKITAEGSMTSPLLTVYLFRRKVYEGLAAARGQAGRRSGIIKAASASDIRMDIDYGFRDPYVTGITCGSINAVSEIADFAELSQNPDFITDEDYIRLDATASVNIGSTLLNYLKGKAGGR